MNAKQLLLQAIPQWPDGITWDEVIERVYFLRKVDRGLKDDEAGRVTPHDEVKQMFGRDVLYETHSD